MKILSAILVSVILLVGCESSAPTYSGGYVSQQPPSQSQSQAAPSNPVSAVMLTSDNLDQYIGGAPWGYAPSQSANCNRQIVGYDPVAQITFSKGTALIPDLQGLPATYKVFDKSRFLVTIASATQWVFEYVSMKKIVLDQPARPNLVAGPGPTPTPYPKPICVYTR